MKSTGSAGHLHFWCSLPSFSILLVALSTAMSCQNLDISQYRGRVSSSELPGVVPKIKANQPMI